MALSLSVPAADTAVKKELDCTELYVKYKIHPLVRSKKGWERVFASVPKMHKLGLAECIGNDNLLNKKILIDCVYDFLARRDSRYNQNLGGY